jgi:prolyl-tRNA synthetase
MRLGGCARVAHYAGHAKYQNLQHKLRTVAAWSQLHGLRRHYHQDARNRCSTFWIPPSKSHGDKKAKIEKEDSNVLLVRAGFFRQAYSGIFHFLPLGLRVQDKIERLLDKHMHSLQASKVSLSSVSSQTLWSRSGRLEGGADVFKFSDRKDAHWLLSPTHEEEITELVGSIAQSYRDLPIRLYQISRKYRDEPRPRQGLLRGREFLMKDLYTFDIDIPAALQTYEVVRAAYTGFFDELKMPYIVAKADSGNMGGQLSHEYHLPSMKGEDSLISCTHCDYVQNEELVESKQVSIRAITSDKLHPSGAMQDNPSLKEAIFITQDKKTLVKVYCRARDGNASDATPDYEINPYAVKAALPEVALGIENPLEQFVLANPNGRSILHMFDDQIAWPEMRAELSAERDKNRQEDAAMKFVESASGSRGIPGLVKLQTGDSCPACSQGRVEVRKAIEIGHTFHLGTRYSEALNVKVAVDPGSKSEHEVFMQMGCHGIGVSRLIAASASSLSDERGLNWPRVIAPFEVIIIPHRQTDFEACGAVYDQILGGEPACNDAIIDDRDLDWLSKLRNADLIGYPIIIFLGKAWRERGDYEVQCRRLKIKQIVSGTDLSGFVRSLLQKL